MDTFTKVIEEPDKGDVIHAPHAEDDLRKGKSAVDVDSPRAAWNGKSLRSQLSQPLLTCLKHSLNLILIATRKLVRKIQ